PSRRHHCGRLCRGRRKRGSPRGGQHGPPLARLGVSGVGVPLRTVATRGESFGRCGSLRQSFGLFKRCRTTLSPDISPEGGSRTGRVLWEGRGEFWAVWGRRVY